MTDPKDMEPVERLIQAAWIGTKDPNTRKRLGQEALKLLTVENLAVLAMVLAVYVLGSAVTAPWSVIVNGVLAGVGLIAFGNTLLKTAPSLISFARIGWYATTEADLQLAAKHFADGLVAVGPDVIIAILGAGAFGLVRRAVLARIKLPRLSEPVPPKAQPKGETPPAKTASGKAAEPAGPKATEPAGAKPTEPAGSAPRPAERVPGAVSRAGGVALDVAAGAGAANLAVGLKAWHLLVPLGVVGAVGVGALLLRSSLHGGK